MPTKVSHMELSDKICAIAKDVGKEAKIRATGLYVSLPIIMAGAPAQAGENNMADQSNNGDVLMYSLCSVITFGAGHIARKARFGELTVLSYASSVFFASLAIYNLFK
ncbi:hypothetical protein HY643_03580 [Candidatus Woesearchaeota archaeon]|nr:hypothetical protein [Candidatus Woesearchaeota archaeon]